MPVSQTGDIFAATWSIPLEFQFYVAFPILTLILARHGSKQILLIIGFMVMLRVGLWFSGKDVNALGYWSIAGRADQFLLGMLSAKLYYEGRAKVFANWTAFIASVVLLMVSVQYYHNIYGAAFPWGQQPMTHWFSTIWPDVQAICFALLLLSFLQLPVRLPRIIEIPLFYVGTISFSLYIMHRLVERGLALAFNWKIIQFTSHQKVNALMTCTIVEVPIVLAVASLAYFAIEKPFHKFKRSYFFNEKTTTTLKEMVESPPRNDTASHLS